MSDVNFRDAFEALTGKPPFPWQEAMYAEFADGKFRSAATLPTGLGKTSVIAIWVIALANHPDRMPRRLVYVVNRRTVVDQSTTFAERLRQQLNSDPRLSDLKAKLAALVAVADDSPLAISTLRGQFADNGEWSKDPSRPAVVVGTIDLIGSRLLFSGYRAGFKTRPLYAGFLGQDVLLVHDEAHLEPAFQCLLNAIRKEQRDRKDFRPLHVMALTATARGDDGTEPFGLTERDLANATVKERLEATKRLAFHPVDDDKKMAAKIVELALAHKESGKAILVFVRTVEAVNEVRKGLASGRDAVPAKSVSTLTGTMRGYERERMAEMDGVFARFLPEPAGGEARTAEHVGGTVYLICTAAGEVGVDMSADHMVCDLTPYDSMAQRFGRVNRYGKGESQIDIVHEAKPSEKRKDDPFDQKRWLTLKLLGELHGDASPAALRGLPREQVREAFSPEPCVPPSSDILFDAWALTTIRDRLPGRPPVADWLHGVPDEWQPREVVVAWRQEVWELRLRYDSDEARKQLEAADRKRLGTFAEDLLEDYPLKPHELLRDRTDRVFKQLESLAGEDDRLPVWVIEPDETVSVTTFGELVAEGKDRLNDCTLLLPPNAGGLTKEGLLGPWDGKTQLDVADEWSVAKGQGKRRGRLWDDTPVPLEWGPMRLVRTIVLDAPAESDAEAGENEATPRRDWKWYVRPRWADDDGSKSARKPQELQPHLDAAGRIARQLATKLGLPPELVEVVVMAAARHDTGKRRRVWQRSIGNFHYPDVVLAKSGGTMIPTELNHYRHEFGSLIEADAEFHDHPERDVILHLIATHHGRGRPYFSADEAFDPEQSESRCIEIAREVPRRYARLQRRFGRWGLAYLESVIRAADYLASEGDGR
ncbi:MAG: type I-U CRISPR-associated helicase/endonuclease Cas3 [Gemmataceae bacterium]